MNVLGSELWVEKDFSYLLTVVREFIVGMWELRKLKLYGKDACPGSQSDSSGWNQGQDGEFSKGGNDKRGRLSHSSDIVDAYTCRCNVDLHVNVCGSAHCCECVVNGLWQPVEYFLYLIPEVMQEVGSYLSLGLGHLG